MKNKVIDTRFTDWKPVVIDTRFPVEVEEEKEIDCSGYDYE
jgi:hypothetical protein